MNALSLERINAIAPYQVYSNGNIYSYLFVTDVGAEYSIDFVFDDSIVTQQEAYQFVIANLNNTKSPRDSKLRDTIMAIVEEFFEKNISTLLYICSTGDGKQMMRQRLFEAWFSGYNHKMLFTKLSSSLIDADGVLNFASVIVRNDNPLMKEVLSEFMETANLLSQKPG